MDIVNDIATIVGLVRDVVLLALLTIALIALLVVFGTVKKLLDTIQDTAESVQDTVNTISEKVVEPAASNAGAMRGLGGFIGFILGLRGRKQRKTNE